MKSGMRGAGDGAGQHVKQDLFCRHGWQCDGWRRGLPALVDSYDSAEELQRQVMTTWTQDDTEFL